MQTIGKLNIVGRKINSLEKINWDLQMKTIRNLFPEDVMTESLSRLPGKSLLRFRCSCKFWFGLARTHDFIQKHLRNYNDDNTRLVILNPQGRKRIQVYTDATLTDLSYKYIDHPIPDMTGIDGPYDGLFSLYNWEKTITLWNPATKEYKTLPKRKAYLPSGKETTIFIPNVGFGFDQISNSYMLILIRSILEDDINDDLSDSPYYESSTVSLYTMSSNSWRDFEVEELNHIHIDCHCKCTCLDGVCYWLAFDDDNNHVIISFTFADKTFKDLSIQNLPESSLAHLGLNDDVLSFLILGISDALVVKWVMKKGCWIKESTIGPLLNVHAPLGFWKNGGFFINSIDRKLLLYDPNSPELKDLEFMPSGADLRCYKESLVMVWSVDT